MPSQPLRAGMPAPGFSLPDAPGHYVSLDTFRGEPVVLLFYAGDFNPVCIRQLTIFNEALAEFLRLQAQVLAVSTDNVWSHLNFSRSYNLHFPLLSDYHPQGRTARDYHVYHYRTGEAVRSAFVIDARGLIVDAYEASGDIAVSANGAISALEQVRKAV